MFTKKIKRIRIRWKYLFHIYYQLIFIIIRTVKSSRCRYESLSVEIECERRMVNQNNLWSDLTKYCVKSTETFARNSLLLFENRRFSKHELHRHQSISPISWVLVTLCNCMNQIVERSRTSRVHTSQSNRSRHQRKRLCVDLSLLSSHLFQRELWKLCNRYLPFLLCFRNGLFGWYDLATASNECVPVKKKLFLARICVTSSRCTNERDVKCML